MSRSPDQVPYTETTARMRTHLSNERTFLAWVRSGLTSIALGIAAAHLLAERQLVGIAATQALAITFIVLGCGFVTIGRFRYRNAARAIENDDFQPRPQFLDAATVLVLSVGVFGIAFVLAIR